MRQSGGCSNEQVADQSTRHFRGASIASNQHIYELHMQNKIKNTIMTEIASRVCANRSARHCKEDLKLQKKKKKP